MIWAHWYFVSSPRNSVNGKKSAFIKSCGNIFIIELTPRPVWSTILNVF